MSWWALLAAAGRAGRGAVGGWALAKWAPGGEGGGGVGWPLVCDSHSHHLLERRGTAEEKRRTLVHQRGFGFSRQLRCEGATCHTGLRGCLSRDTAKFLCGKRDPSKSNRSRRVFALRCGIISLFVDFVLPLLEFATVHG